MVKSLAMNSLNVQLQVLLTSALAKQHKHSSMISVSSTGALSIVMDQVDSTSMNTNIRWAPLQLLMPVSSSKPLTAMATTWFLAMNSTNGRNSSLLNLTILIGILKIITMQFDLHGLRLKLMATIPVDQCLKLLDSLSTPGTCFCHQHNK